MLSSLTQVLVHLLLGISECIIPFKEQCSGWYLGFLTLPKSRELRMQLNSRLGNLSHHLKHWGWRTTPGFSSGGQSSLLLQPYQQDSLLQPEDEGTCICV